MNSRSILAIAWLASLAVIVPSAARASTASQDSTKIVSLLGEIKTHAALASDDAARLESYSRSKLSWQSHNRQLVRIKGHVDRLLEDYNLLNSLRPEGSAWQQEAIDRIDPLLREIADNLTATINHLNDNRDRVHMQPFRNYASANAKLLEEASKTVSDMVDYGEAKATSERLQRELELPETAAVEK